MKEKNRTVLVVGGGIAGIEAALGIGQAGYKAVLVEKEPALGGTLRRLCGSFPRWENPQDRVNQKVNQLQQCPNVEVLTETVVSSCQREDKGFSVGLYSFQSGKERTIEAAAAVLATGFDFYDAARYGEYGYGLYPQVITSMEFEDRLREWRSNKNGGSSPRVVAFFKCVGSRDRVKGYPYCSKICCMYTAKQAGMLKDLFPEARCYVFYMDYRAAGKDYEEFVRSVIEQKHVRYVRGRPSKVLPQNERLIIRAEDTLMGVPLEVETDLVVLATAIIPRRETLELAELFGAATDKYGFLEPENGSVAKAGPRVFLAGGCGFAVESLGAQQQGAAAAAEVIALLADEE